MMGEAALHFYPGGHSSSCVSSTDVQLKAVRQLLEGHMRAALDDQMENAIREAIHCCLKRCSILCCFISNAQAARSMEFQCNLDHAQWYMLATYPLADMSMSILLSDGSRSPQALCNQKLVCTHNKVPTWVCCAYAQAWDLLPLQQ